MHYYFNYVTILNSMTSIAAFIIGILLVVNFRTTTI